MKKNKFSVMLNLFQHLTNSKIKFNFDIGKIPKQVRDDAFVCCKVFAVIIFMAILLCGCSQDKAGILFNRYPITEQTIFNHTKTFPVGARIYYVVLMPKKVESRYLFIQVVQKDNDYGMMGYNLIWSKDIRLKDEEVNYFTDYLVLNRKGHYVMQVYSKDNPHKVLAESQFFVGM